MPRPGRSRRPTHARRLPVALALAAGLLLTTAAPSFAADAPDTCAGATTPSARQAWLAETLASASDVDWFLFQKPSTTTVIATLGKLPGNDRLALYGACDAPIASSDAGGNAFEEIQRSLPAGDYRLRVSHVAGATGSYQLRFLERAPDTCGYLSYHVWIGPGDTWNIVGELLNTHAVDIYRPRVLLYFLKGDTSVQAPIPIHTVSREIVAGGRAPFKLSIEPPPDHDRIWVNSQCAPSQWETPLPLRVMTWASSVDLAGIRHFSGTVRNDSGVRIYTPWVLVTLHDSLGRITNAAAGPIPADSNAELDIGETATFDAEFFHHHAANRFRIVADGFKAVNQ